MKIVELGYPDNDVADTLFSSVAVGNFDGVHIGHQHVIRRAKSLAEKSGLKSGVMTFHPHPRQILQGDNGAAYSIMSLQRKLERIEELGVDLLYLLRFDRHMAKLTPDEFVNRYILAHHIRELVVGYDFRFGCKGSGNTDTLRNLSLQTGGFGFHVVLPVTLDGDKISSTRIRNCIAGGRMEEVHRLMGGHYRIEAVAGPAINARNHRFAEMTIEAQAVTGCLMPAPGAYQAEIRWRGQRQRARVEVGCATGELKLYMPAVDRSLYGACIMIDFLEVAAGERRIEVGGVKSE